MSNRRKRKQARKKARREARKARQAELEAARQAREEVTEAHEKVSQADVITSLEWVDEWDDHDPLAEERAERDREIKARRASKQEMIDEALSL